MRVLALTGLLLLVCSTSASEEMDIQENRPNDEKKTEDLGRDESSVLTPNDISALETDGALSSSTNGSGIVLTSVTNQAITVNNVAYSPDNVTTANTAKIENIVNTSDDNEISSSSLLVSSSTPVLSTIITTETIVSTTDIQEATLEMYVSPTQTLTLPTVSSTGYKPTQELSDNKTSTPTAEEDGHKNETKIQHRGSKAFIGLYIVLPVVIAAVVVLIVLYAVMIYLHRDRFCRKKQRKEKEQEPEIVDSDQELYSTVNIYTNYRHHGARAESTPLSKEPKLMTKMESEYDCHTDNSLDLTDQLDLDSGRYVSPEGLVYVTVAHAQGQENKKPTPKKREKTKKDKKKSDNNKTQYASLDFDKTGKPNLKTEDKKSRKEKKTKKKSKV